VNLRANYNLMPLAVKTTVGEHKRDFLVNPPEVLALQAGTVIIVMGDVEEVRHARRDAQSVHAHAAGTAT
jgi:hypothetical protein